MSAHSPVLAPTRTVFSADFGVAPWGLTLAAGDDDDAGPAGFGVDASGTTHVVDGYEQRVILIDANGNRSIEQLPTELAAKGTAQGFAVGPDGTEYLTLGDGLAIVHNGKLITAFTRTDLGWNGIYFGPKANAAGVWLRYGDTWTLVATPTGQLVHGVVSASNSEPGATAAEAVEMSNDGPVPTFAYTSTSRETIRVTSTPQVGAAYVDREVGNDLQLLLEQTAPRESLVLCIVHDDGAHTAFRIAVPTENMVTNGLEALTLGNVLYLETGSVKTITVTAYDLSRLGS
jgi:hypothetical protein